MLPGRPDTTAAVTRGAALCLTAAGFAVVAEVRLATGKRVDLMGLDSRGGLIVVEVKSCREDFRVDTKWSDYNAFCDGLYFAVSPDFPQDLLPRDQGLIVADGFGGAILRAPVPTPPLVAARRKAVTLLFARTAAQRLATPTGTLTGGEP
jgi:hypothetical protein